MTDQAKGCVNRGLDDHDTKDCTRLPVVVTNEIHEALEDTSMFADLLYGAGWRAHADAQHSGADDLRAKLKALIAELRAENERLVGARDHLRLQASIQAQEARTQKSIVMEIGKLVDCDQDFLVASAVRAQLQAAPAERGVVPNGAVLIGKPELALIRNSLKRDVSSGLHVRGEILAELDASVARYDSLNPAPADHVEPAAQPVADEREAVTMQQVLIAYDYATEHPDKYLRGSTNWCAAFANSINGQLKEPNHG